MKCTALRLCTIFALSLVTFGQNTTSALPPAGYTITDLGTLGGTTSMANAINNSGQIAGTSTTAGDAASHAFRYSAGVMQDLGTLGGLNSAGNAINSLGFVAGWANLSGRTPTDPCYWSPTSGVHDMGRYSSIPSGQALAIDDFAHVLGTANNSFDGDDAFGWTKAKGYINLRGLGGRVSEAHGVDSAGKQVVGLSNASGDFNTLPFTWSSAASIHQLPLFTGGFDGEALAINNVGHIVGDGDNSSFATHAALWIKGASTPQDLGTLGGFTSSARALNSSDVVVGSSLPSTGTTTHAFVWTSAGGMVDLNTLIPPASGWVLTVANGVNDNGQIVGNGTINGQTHGFLLTPAN